GGECRQAPTRIALDNPIPGVIPLAGEAGYEPIEDPVRRTHNFGRELQLTREIPRSTRATCPRNGHRRYNRASGGRIALTPQMRTIEHIVASKRHRPPRASDWQWTSTPQVCCREEHQSGEDLPLSGSDRQEFRFRSERAFPNECA